MKGAWEDAEVIDLFSEVERGKRQNKSIKEAFLIHAKKYSRKANSVRNYYYKEVDNLLKDKGRAKRMNINLSLHKKQDISFFSVKEGENIVKEINKLVGEGLSVRQACLKLSGGNASLMLRYQNKYRNETIKEKSEQNQKMVNIGEFKNKRNALTDSDINSLFMGLVKLIKKTAIENVSEEILEKERELERKEEEILQLKNEICKLEIENKKLAEYIDFKKISRAKLLVEKLAKYKAGNKEIAK